MATSKGATMHQHNDYKIQQEFERVGRAASKVSETILYQQSNSGNRGITNTIEPTLWALTIEKNGIIQLANSDKKIVQVLNFKEVPRSFTAKPISCLVKWNIEKQIPSTDLLTIPNGIGMDIKAVAELDKRDLDEWLNSVIYYYLNTVTDKNAIQLQSVPSAIWTCNHGLSKYVSISTFDGITGKRIYGNEEQNSTDTTIITFNHSRWGWWTAN